MKVTIEKRNEMFELCSNEKEWVANTYGDIKIPQQCSECPKLIKRFCDEGEYKYIDIDESILYGNALDLWGEDAQFNQLMEELAELIIATNKIRREANGIEVEQMAEELIDAEIMIRQARMLLPLSIKEFDEIKEKKLTRLYHKIREEK